MDETEEPIAFTSDSSFVLAGEQGDDAGVLREGLSLLARDAVISLNVSSLWADLQDALMAIGADTAPVWEELEL